jgi:hypothetical protein
MGHDRQDEIIKRRLQHGEDEYLIPVDMQPESTLLKRMTEAVLKNMFHLRATTSASFDNRDFITKLAEANRVEIRCRTFYIYYPQSKEQRLREVINDLETEVYERIIFAYTYKPTASAAPLNPLLQRLRALATKIPLLQKLLTDALAADPSQPAEPQQPPPPGGLKKLIDDELRKECKRRGVDESEIQKVWESINNKTVWLRDHVFGCWLRHYPKDDPSLQIYIVGRPNLYYRPVLEALDKSESRNGEPIYLAARLKLRPEAEGKLNMHDYNRRTPEYIHIIDTQEEWEFSIGSLEHDDFIIEGRDDRQKYVVPDVRWRDGWLFPEPPAGGDIVLERMGYKCPYLEYVTTVTEVGYVPNLRLQGRVLPRLQQGDKGKLQKDAALVRALAGQGISEESVQSAIEVEPNECWLVGSKATDGDQVEAWLCFASGQDWACSKLEHRGPISTGKRAYVWRYNDNSAPLPDCYVGELVYTDRFKPIEITAIKGQPQVFGREGPFVGLHDNSLSTNRQLVLHSQGRDQSTRALYLLEHNPGSLNPSLFIIHYNNNRGEPLYLRYKKPNESSPPVRYNGSVMTDITLNDKNFVQCEGNSLLLSGESILLICGTSTLMLNTSSSIRLGGIAEPAKAEKPSAPQLAPRVAGWASVENVEVTLHKSARWADVHVSLPRGDVQGTYTQGFVFDKGGESYFVKCYRSDLREDQDNRILAQQEVKVYRQCEDLPVVPQLYDVLPDEEAPQLLVMPKLTPLEVTGLSLVEILAVGYAMAILLERLEEHRLVHYDIRTTKFNTDRGMIRLIDYNSVFPVLDEGEPLQPLHWLLVKSGLPEVSFLSPERRDFLDESESGRLKVLHKIGPASSVYALAKVLLSIRRLEDASELAQQWEQELDSGHGQWVGALLEAMLSDDAAQRPTAAIVKTDIKTVLFELKQKHANHQNVLRAETLLGSALDS